ncbi:hypothetical protein NMG60_11021440 [Bertholletia excelsa]
MTASPLTGITAAAAAVAARVPPLLDREFLSSIFVSIDKCLLRLAERSKAIRLLRYLLVSAFLFLLRLFFPSLCPPANHAYLYHFKVPKDIYVYAATAASRGDSGIARALSQLLTIVNDLPVSSRKYDIVQSLAGTIIDENIRDGSESLREVNCAVLSAAFLRTLSRLESAVVNRDRSRGRPRVTDGEHRRISRVVRAVWYYGHTALTRFGRSAEEVSLSENWPEKLAAEVLWLAQKMAASGCVEDAVEMWASLSNLAWLALSAEPRLQGSLVKVSAFLFKEAKDLGTDKDEESRREQLMQTKLNMLMSWLPLLCRASNGTDVPTLSMIERVDLEKVLEETINMLEREEDQEKVLSLWLHHFTCCPSSDWPDLLACYAKWCNAARKRLLPANNSRIELQMSRAIREQLDGLLDKGSSGNQPTAR